MATKYVKVTDVDTAQAAYRAGALYRKNFLRFMDDSEPEFIPFTVMKWRRSDYKWRSSMKTALTEGVVPPAVDILVKEPDYDWDEYVRMHVRNNLHECCVLIEED